MASAVKMKKAKGDKEPATSASATVLSNAYHGEKQISLMGALDIFCDEPVNERISEGKRRSDGECEDVGNQQAVPPLMQFRC